MPIGLPPPRPIPIRDRASFLFLERGNVDVVDGAFVLIDAEGVRTQIPVGGLACLMLEPGIRITHAAVALAARVGTLLVWVGEPGVRLYSSGQPGGARSDRLLWQAKLALDPQARLNVVRKMFAMRFGELAPERRSVDQLRGLEGARVRKIYAELADRHGVRWDGRNYRIHDFDGSDLQNRCLSQATSCLYGVAEAAVLAAGYAPAIGFVHTGKARSFVFDVADVFKFETVVPVAFEVVAEHGKGSGRAASDPLGETRRRCRDAFRRTRLMSRLVPSIEEMLESGGISRDGIETAIHPVAFEEAGAGDAGHRG